MNELLNPFFLLIVTSTLISLLVVNHHIRYSETLLNKFIYNILSIIFLIVFIIHGYQYGATYGLCITLFLWAFFVCSVPIPQVALLLSLPLKHFLNITIATSQMTISVIAMFILYYYHHHMKSILNFHKVGKVFQTIMKHKLYFIFLLSIVASVLGSYLIDSFIDIYLIHPREKQENERMRNVLLSVILFLLLNIWYVNYSKKHQLFF